MASRTVTRGELIKARAAIMEKIVPVDLPILLSFRVWNLVTWSKTEADHYTEATLVAASKIGTKTDNGGWALTPAQQAEYLEMISPLEKDAVSVPKSCLLSLKALSEAGATISARDLLQMMPLLELDVELSAEKEAEPR